MIHLLFKLAKEKYSCTLFVHLNYKEKNKQTSINRINSLVKQMISDQQSAFRSNELKKINMSRVSKTEAEPHQENMICVLQEEFKTYSKSTHRC